jgi:hypothetical protein
MELLSERNLSRRRLQPRVDRVMAAQSSYLAVEELRFVPFLGSAVARWIDSIARRRVERVRLALVAYRLDRGEYPESLAALSPNYLPAADFQDPFAAGPLQFRHEGFELPFLQFVANGRLHPPNAPVLWSIGKTALTPKERSSYIQFRDDGTIAGFLDSRDADQDSVRHERFLQLTPTEQFFVPDRASFILTLPTKFPNETSDEEFAH